MNPVSSLVFKWYLFLTLLAAFAATSFSFLSLMSGLVFAWVVFVLFFLGANKTISLSNIQPVKPKLAVDDYKIFPMSLLAVFAVMASMYASDFYTGKSVFEVFAAIALNASLYNEYQRYFVEQGLAAFSIAKIPAILSMIYLKIAVIYSYLCVFVLTRQIKMKNLLWLVVISLASLYFSISRGTSFEFFELLLLFWFSLSMRAFRYQTANSIISPQRIALVTVALLALSLYIYNVSARYSFGEVAECATKELCLDTDSMLFYFSAPIAKLTFKLSAYFTFGIYYTSALINFFGFDEFFNFIQLFLPFSSIYDDDITHDFLCGNLLDCGAAWVPDVVLYLIKVGFTGVLFGAYVVGRVVRAITAVALASSDPVKYALLYMGFLALVSLPVGNFLTISSANIMTLALVISIYTYRRLMRKP